MCVIHDPSSGGRHFIEEFIRYKFGPHCTLPSPEFMIEDLDNLELGVLISLQAFIEVIEGLREVYIHVGTIPAVHIVTGSSCAGAEFD